MLLDAAGAAEAQRVVADSQKTASAYGQLAYYLYADFQFPEGDAAAKQAVAASDPGDQKAIEKSLAALAERARKQKELIDKQAQQAQQQGGQDAGSAELDRPVRRPRQRGAAARRLRRR